MKKVVNEEDKFYILEKEFRTNLKKVRKENGYTQETLARKCSIIRETIARIESGTVSPQLNTLLKILEPIGYTIEIKKIETETPTEENQNKNEETVQS